MQSEYCAYHIAGWTVTGGLAPIPNPTMVNLQMFDLEDPGPGYWYSTIAHVYDPTNFLTGVIVTQFNTLLLDGAKKVKFVTMSNNGQSRVGFQHVIDCTDGAFSNRDGTFIVAFDPNTWHSIEFKNTSGVGTFMAWKVEVDQGIYDVQVYTLHQSYGGIYTIKQTGTVMGTFDTYSATNLPSIDTIAAVAFPQGVAEIRLDITGKNASSAGYVTCFTKIILSRKS